MFSSTTKTIASFFFISLAAGLTLSGVLLASFYSQEFIDNQYTGPTSQIQIQKPEPIQWEENSKYLLYFNKGLRRADILEVKNSQLQTPINISDSISCIRKKPYLMYKGLSPDPKEAFSLWMGYCSFQDFADQIEDQKNAEIKAEKLKKLRKNTNWVSNLSIPENVINTVLNKKNWNANTQTLLGNQQGIVHDITNQQTPALKELGINELIGVGLSRYYHSSSSRKINLRNAASKINGQIIHPGDSISIANTFAPFTYGNGYVEGIIIQNGEDAKAMGGGVCQSVTTMFRAWQNAGLEVTKFQPHSKNISYYGGIGLDATMYYTGKNWGNVDLVLKNNTENSILIKIVDRDPYQIVLLYGTKDRKVSLSRYAFNKYKTNQVAKWKRSIEYNNSGTWVDNYFQENQKRY